MALDSKNLRKKHSENRFATPGTLSEKEFQEGIKAAEEGEFYSVQESMTEIEQWLRKRKKGK